MQRADYQKAKAWRRLSLIIIGLVGLLIAVCALTILPLRQMGLSLESVLNLLKSALPLALLLSLFLAIGALATRLYKRADRTIGEIRGELVENETMPPRLLPSAEGMIEQAVLLSPPPIESEAGQEHAGQREEQVWQTIQHREVIERRKKVRKMKLDKFSRQEIANAVKESVEVVKKDLEWLRANDLLPRD
jgi:hypothetical protein